MDNSHVINTFNTSPSASLFSQFLCKLNSNTVVVIVIVDSDSGHNDSGRLLLPSLFKKSFGGN